MKCHCNPFARFGDCFGTSLYHESNLAHESCTLSLVYLTLLFSIFRLWFALCFRAHGWEESLVQNNMLFDTASW